jgi:predicted nucleotidyltransferase
VLPISNCMVTAKEAICTADLSRARLDVAQCSAHVVLMTTLLEKMQQERLQGRERLRAEVRRQLREVLPQTIPGQRVVVFGSLAKPGRFSEGSDIDLALESEPPDMSLYQLTSLLAERMGRRVDVVLLPESRLRDKILREGETWTLPA